MMKITVIGTGYVGLVTGTCLADLGFSVICVDNDAEKIEMLNKGISPIFEPGLQEIIQRNLRFKRLEFTTDIEYAVDTGNILFICVGTPPTKSGSADLKYVRTVAKDIAKYMNGYKIIVNKSTVPVGTGKMIKEIISKELSKRKKAIDYDIISNPEFLKEGSAVYDFTHPDRIVIGYESDKARQVIKRMYTVFSQNGVPFIETNIETAEMIKYCTNAFLAIKVGLINEFANLCEKVGADITCVTKALGCDSRINPKFLRPGPGYGGSCFPKDTEALADIGRRHDSPLLIVEACIKANKNQKLLMVKKISQALGDVRNKVIAILGLSFKPDTDDIRESPSIIIIRELAKMDAKIKVYDPAAMEKAKSFFVEIENKITYCNDEYEAIQDADALVIVTEWNQFKSLDLDRVKSCLRQPYFFDLRNIYKREYMEQNGFIYFGVGQ